MQDYVLLYRSEILVMKVFFAKGNFHAIRYPHTEMLSLFKKHFL